MWKKHEDRIARSFKKHKYFYRRIKTRSSGFKNDQEIADFYYYHNGLRFIEAKSVKDLRMPFSMIQPYQVVGMHEASLYEGVHAGILIEYRGSGRVFYIPIETLAYYLELNNKSITQKEAEADPNIVEVMRQGSVYDLSNI